MTRKLRNKAIDALVYISVSRMKYFIQNIIENSIGIISYFAYETVKR